MGHIKSAVRVTRSRFASIGRYTRPFSLRADDLLEQRVFPFIVRYSTHPAHIAFLILLWMALLVFGSYAVFALTGGNYFNGLCGIVSCVLLGQQMNHHKQIKRMHDDSQAERTRIEKKHADDIAAVHKQVAELRQDLLVARAMDAMEAVDATKSQPAAKTKRASATRPRTKSRSQFDPDDPIDE